MTKISLIGTGNVAFHLCKVFTEQNVEVEIYGRNKVNVKKFESDFNIKNITDLKEIDPQSLAVLCVNDDQIQILLNQIDSKISVAYTSGTVSLDSLPKRENIGIFYPLQTFSKSRKIDFFQVPILIEANNEFFAQKLFDFAWKMSSKVEFADSEKRKKVHLAAVFVNNFTNHLFYLAKNQVDKAGIDWNLLNPLIKETVVKIQDLSPFDAQTGPAKRGDFSTIESQINLLESNILDENSLEIYKLMTKSIIETYKIK